MDFIVRKRSKKDYVQYTFRIEEELMERIKDIVEENNLSSINGFVNDSIRFALNNAKIK